MARRSTRSPSGHTILAVDDQQDSLVSARNLLEREGHRVITAESGEQALAVLKTTEVDLMIVDYVMPRMNGAQLVRAVRSFDPFVQIILQTGYAGEEPPRVMLAELDIQGYHDKADDPERLLLWVDVALKTHRLVKALRERERAQAELVANCSHEFRTPVNIIVGYAELLLDRDFGELPPDAVRPLRAIEEAARSLGELVSDFLRYARIEAGVDAVKQEWVDVGELAGEMQRLAAPLLEDRGVVFALELALAPPRLLTDATKLRTILRNLIINAAKFTAAGTVALRILQRGGALRLEVRDTGPGIRPEDQELIFEPFRQLDGSSTRQHGGVGLGLALSRRLARMLGGDVQVQSEPGVGSTFALVLPAEAAGLSAPPAAPRLVSLA
jgi:signal transduction histidine kinase